MYRRTRGLGNATCPPGQHAAWDGTCVANDPAPATCPPGHHRAWDGSCVPDDVPPPAPMPTATDPAPVAELAGFPGGMLGIAIAAGLGFALLRRFRR